ncbi:MAG: hypothetical protein ABFD16_14175 [Thermoguttaceae bacterium]|jgi:hypothetical protein
MDADFGFGPKSVSQMMELWFDLASKMSQTMPAFSPQQTPPEAFRQLRSAQLGAWGDCFQELMRKPEFLEAVKQWTSFTVQARKQWSDFLGQLQHEFQGASRQDIDQLMLSLRHLESRVVEGVEEIATQLDGIDARLRSLEKLHEHNGQTREEKHQRRKEKRRHEASSTDDDE